MTNVCLANNEQPRSILNTLDPWTNFHSKVRRSEGWKRSSMKRCYVGCLNVRTLRLERIVKKGKLLSKNEAKIDYYKDIMRENGLYVPAMSEVRRDDSG